MARKVVQILAVMYYELVPNEKGVFFYITMLHEPNDLGVPVRPRLSRVPTITNLEILALQSDHGDQWKEK